MKISIPATVVLLLAGISIGAQPALPLAEAMPAGAMVYVGWAGRSLTFDGSHLGQALQDPAMHAAATSLKSAFLSVARQHEVEESASHVWRLADVLWRHPVAVAVYPPASPDGPARFLAVADTEKDRDAVARLLDAFQGSLKMDVETTQIGGAAFRRAALANTDLLWALVGSRLIVTSSRDTATGMLETKPATSLAADAGLRARLKEVLSANLQFVFYVDTGHSALSDRLPPGEPATEFERFFQALQKGYLAHATCIEKRGLRSRTRVALPGLRDGLIPTLRGEALEIEDLDWVPRDAMLVWAARLDGSKLAEYLTKSRPPDDQAAGLARHFADLTGDRWVLASAPSLGGMFTGTVLSVTVRDAEGIHKQLGRFLALLGGGPDSVRTIRSGQSEIRYAVASASKGAISPAYMIRGNRLYVAAWPQVLQSLLAMDPKDKLIEAPGFKEMRQTLGPPGQFLEYVNPRELLRTLYGGLMLASSALSSMAAQDGVDLSPELLPALHHLSRLASPAVVSMRIDEDGWWSDSYGPTGGLANALTIPSLSMAVTVALPAIARAREIARHTISATRLRNLHTAITMYEARHGKPPEGLEDLVRAGMIQPASLSRPGDHVKPTFQNGRLRGPLYYTYQAPPVLTSKLENPRDTVLAYSLAALHGQSDADVLFADGRVEQMPWPHLRKLLAGQNDQP